MSRFTLPAYACLIILIATGIYEIAKLVLR
jgi:hypothetical protein